MNKTIQLKLSKYDVVPNSLRFDSRLNLARPDVSVNLGALFHHYYLDTYGRCPPDPNPTAFEHVRFLMPTQDFRFQGKALGASTAARRSRSSELGQAFCRWFLHDHLNITYFAHMSEVIDRQLHRAFQGCSIKRTVAGDTPDYLCAESVERVYLAEAKGRYNSISFSNAEFDVWRAQFERVQVFDHRGVPRRVKGHIVGTRFATETNGKSVNTTLFAEDPETNGDGPLEGDAARGLGATVIRMHYGRFAEKINQPLLAAALVNALPLPEEIRVPIVLWRSVLDPVKDRRFVGGYFPGPSGGPAFEITDGGVQFRSNDPFRLDAENGTFVGLEENIFRQLVQISRSTESLDQEIRSLESFEPFYSAISILRDGSVVGPVELFLPVMTATL